MSQINVYLHFDNNCREAMNFYKEVFGGELDLKIVGGTPMAEHLPAEKHNSIMHSTLKSGGLSIMASDMLLGEPIKGNTVSISLNFDDQTEMKAIFDKLSEGGKVTMPLSEQFWGTFGQLDDKYGFHWMLNYEEPNA